LQSIHKSVHFSEHLEWAVEGFLSEAEERLSRIDESLDRLQHRLGAEGEAMIARLSSLVSIRTPKAMGRIRLN
jgi:hypothetical protein